MCVLLSTERGWAHSGFFRFGEQPSGNERDDEDRGQGDKAVLEADCQRLGVDYLAQKVQRGRATLFGWQARFFHLLRDDLQQGHTGFVTGVLGSGQIVGVNVGAQLQPDYDEIGAHGAAQLADEVETA